MKINPGYILYAVDLCPWDSSSKIVEWWLRGRNYTSVSILFNFHSTMPRGKSSDVTSSDQSSMTSLPPIHLPPYIMEYAINDSLVQLWDPQYLQFVIIKLCISQARVLSSVTQTVVRFHSHFLRLEIWHNTQVVDYFTGIRAHTFRFAHLNVQLDVPIFERLEI